MNLIITWLLVIALVAGAWVVNLVKLTSCDFQSPYKCEVLHGAGLIPIIGVFTAWFDSDESKAP